MTSQLLSPHVYTTTRELYQGSGNILEIGVFNGVGTEYLCCEYPNKTVYSIDPFIEDGNTVQASGYQAADLMVTQQQATRARLANLANSVLFEITSADFADMLTSEMIADLNIDWIIIDGSHHYADVVVDSELALRVLSGRGGGIVFDDLEQADVRRAHNKFVSQQHDRIVQRRDIAGGVASVIFLAAEQ
jgi:predicted O-methyltransferase YrrM